MICKQLREGIEICAIVQGTLERKLYQGYSKHEAIRKFRAEFEVDE